MAPDFGRSVRQATFVLLALASFAVEIAAGDGKTLLRSLGQGGAWVILAALVARGMPLPADPRRKPPLGVLVLVVALAVAPLAVEPLRRSWTGEGHPLEIQMVCGLRNVGLSLAACAGWILCLRLACVVSLFLMLFAAAMTNHNAVLILLGLYTATGSVWLMLVYWAGLGPVLVSSGNTVTVEVQASRPRIPWLGLGLLLLCLGAALTLVLVGPARLSLSLGEWLPTSGGTGDIDPFARYGIGDGPEETAGENARAAGMVDTDRMIEDNKNSLIDAVSDMYGLPRKPKGEQERTVAAGKVEVIENHGRLADNRRPSRDFDTSRQGPKVGKKPGSRSARSLFEVEGRTPLHVRMVVYEEYNAAEHRWIEGRKPAHRLLDSIGGDWMEPAQFRNADWYLADERHRLKAADLRTNLVPTPSLLTRLRIQRVDKPDYYDWDYEGVLSLNGRKRTPPGVIVHTDCHTLDPDRLPESAFAREGVSAGVHANLLEVPASVRLALAERAEQWAGQLPPGWPQIAAVRDRLRGYRLDREAVAPADHPAPVRWYLEESQHGPDYLFATAAALMYRSLGYPARVCLGYYVAPEAYDAETGHTPVRAADLHFWPEVLLRDGQWLVVEPTPGYDVLPPTLPLAQRLLLVLRQALDWCRHHAVAMTLGLVLLVLVWVYHCELLDALAVWHWLWFGGATWRDRVRGTVAVLERRGRWVGQPRPPQRTIPTWLSKTLPEKARSEPELLRLLHMAEWAAYAAELPPPWTEAEVRMVCQHVLAGWSLRRWRDVSRGVYGAGSCQP